MVSWAADERLPGWGTSHLASVGRIVRSILLDKALRPIIDRKRCR
jgi:hypothetical protein